MFDPSNKKLNNWTDCNMILHIQAGWVKNDKQTGFIFIAAIVKVS